MTTQLSDMAGRSNTTPRARMGKATAWALIVLLLIATLFPFYWTMRTALSTNPALFSGDQGLLPPEFTGVNFKRILGLASEEEIQAASGRQNSASFDYLLALRNSIIIATTIAVGQVFFSAMAAYAFARLRFAGRDKIFFLYLSGLMIPPIFILIPNLILMRDLGWINTFQGVVAPFALMTPFAVFFLRQFFLSINRSLEEAALIDGASHFRIFRSVILPIASPQMITLGILTYVTAWNEFLWPLVIARDEAVQPLTVALGVFTTQQPGSSPDWSGLMTGTLMAALPVIIIYLIFGKRIVDSIRFSGIK